jgi:hypothetical protein
MSELAIQPVLRPSPGVAGDVDSKFSVPLRLLRRQRRMPRAGSTVRSMWARARLREDGIGLDEIDDVCIRQIPLAVLGPVKVNSG